MESALASAASIADQRQKIEQYKLILASVLASNDITQAKKFIDHSKKKKKNRTLSFLLSLPVD